MPSDAPSASRLSRVLGLRELILYGIILIQPTAPMPLFGVVAQEAHGHVVTTVLIGMVAMLFTAFSYGKMANAYPSAGSGYAYVSRELHPSLGYLVGWGMMFDYVMNPIICVVWCAKAWLNFIPGVPPPILYPLCAIGFTLLFTTMNLRGIKASSRTNTWVAGGLGVVIVLFLAAVTRYLWLQPPVGPDGWTRPFYDPQTFTWQHLSTGTSLAVLTYIGFDGISTLSEEVHNPRRNILLATVWTCLLTGVLAAIQVYAAQLVWPETNNFPDVDTAFVHVSGKAGGPWLFLLVNLALLVASIGSGSGAQLGAGRLLYGMGCDNAIPRRFFGALNPKTNIPSNNIILVGGLTLAGAFLLSYQLGAELLNFGAFIAFMGVNASAFVRYFVRNPRKTLGNLLPPLLGFVVCLYIWLSLRPLAMVVGAVWLA
ncbi:MAG: APC family permease, partial [Verrucomicrobia bacterium]|nr:APC family permease [Verrucomicrobiota bacterium]